MFVCLFFFPKSAPEFVTGADKSERTRLQLSRSSVLSQPCIKQLLLPQQAVGWEELVPSTCPNY